MLAAGRGGTGDLGKGSRAAVGALRLAARGRTSVPDDVARSSVAGRPAGIDLRCSESRMASGLSDLGQPGSRVLPAPALRPVVCPDWAAAAHGQRGKGWPSRRSASSAAGQVEVPPSDGDGEPPKPERPSRQARRSMPSQL